MEEFRYLSADGSTQIHAVCWLSDGAPRAVLQIVHGVNEYIERYRLFAEFMANHGYAVFGADLLGHGQSVTDKKDLGYIGKGGNELLIRDIDELRRIAGERYPELPYLIMGSDVGSFLVRQYLVEGDPLFAEDVCGAVLVGTGWLPESIVHMRKMLSGFSGMFLGEHYRSRLIDRMNWVGYNRRIQNPKTKNDWLSRDEAVVERFEEEPLCQVCPTVNAYYNIFKGIEISQDTRRMERLPANLSLLLISGAEDPAGDYGDGVRKAYMEYLEHSPCDVYIKLYEGDRHEILNEMNRERVFGDLLKWTDSFIDKKVDRRGE